MCNHRPAVLGEKRRNFQKHTLSLSLSVFILSSHTCAHTHTVVTSHDREQIRFTTKTVTRAKVPWPLTHWRLVKLLLTSPQFHSCSSVWNHQNSGSNTASLHWRESWWLMVVQKKIIGDLGRDRGAWAVVEGSFSMCEAVSWSCNYFQFPAVLSDCHQHRVTSGWKRNSFILEAYSDFFLI